MTDAKFHLTRRSTAVQQDWNQQPFHVRDNSFQFCQDINMKGMEEFFILTTILQKKKSICRSKSQSWLMNCFKCFQLMNSVLFARWYCSRKTYFSGALVVLRFFFFRFQCPFADNYFWMPHELSIKFISSAFLIYNVTQSYHLTKSFRKDIRDAIDSCAWSGRKRTVNLVKMASVHY